MITSETTDGLGNHPPFNVAIVGGGIIGLQVALGLLKRNIPVTVYEQAVELKEIGVGFGFSFNIVECMKALDPRIAESLAKVAIKSNGNIRWIDGFSQEDVRLRPRDQLFDMEIRGGETFLCHRGQFLSEMAKLMPPDQIWLGKRLGAITENGENEKLLLNFCDGTTAEADVIIGCDGIKSRVRQIVLGEDSSAAFPHYAHESAYRCLVDMDKAVGALGEITKSPIMYVGHGAHIMTYPVADRKYLNIAAFIRDSSDYPDSDNPMARASKKDVVEAYSKFGPTVRALVDLIPDELNRWAMFDTLDNPLQTFAYGRIVLAGDAAHGSTPHHGAGAGMGVEDALVLASVLERATVALKTNHGAVSKSKALVCAFEAYDSVRRERAQWLVASSRRQGEMVKWLDLGVGKDPEKFIEATRECVDKIRYYDWKHMLCQATDEFESRL